MRYLVTILSIPAPFESAPQWLCMMLMWVSSRLLPVAMEQLPPQASAGAAATDWKDAAKLIAEGSS